MSLLSNIQYEIQHKNVKNINMRIRSDGVLYISAPKNTSKAEIENLILKHYDRFYEAQLKTIEKNIVLNQEVAHKNNVYLLGKKYLLEYVKDTKFSYSIGDSKVSVYYRNLEKSYTRMLREEADKVFNELSKEISAEMNLDYIRIENKDFKSCFGKNYGRERICLNYRLVHLPIKYIKHVLYHEYAHCIEMNHSKKFYDILSKYDINHKLNKMYIVDNLHKYS